MTLSRKTIIDDIHVTRSGEVKVTLAIIVLDDADEIAASYSYVDIKAGSTVDEQVVLINDELALTKKPPVEDFSLLKKIAEVVIAADAALIKLNGEKV